MCANRMVSSRWSVLIISSLSLISTTSPSKADLVSVSDPTYGPDSITRDTATGLEWLDVTVTSGRSYFDIRTQLGVPFDGYPIGTEFEGWRYATPEEVEFLFFQSAAIPDVGTSIPNSGPTAALLDLLGILTPGPDRNRSYMIYSDGIPDPRIELAYLEVGVSFQGNPIGTAALFPDSGLGIYDTNAGTDELPLGSLLVRNATVPEPASLALALSGFSGLWFIAIRRRRKLMPLDQAA